MAQWLELSVINSGDVDVTKPTYCARYYPGRQPVTYVCSVLNLCVPKLSLVSAIQPIYGVRCEALTTGPQPP